MAGIPRHDAMKPLSRHHHHALVAAMNIRRAFKDEAVTEETIEQLRTESIQFWNKDGNEHFREEEEILLPAYVLYASARHEEIIEMLIEHAQIRALMVAIIDRVGDLAKNLQQLSEALETHVRREERVIFPMMEEALPDEVLQKLAPYFHEFH